mmetsp:Transcript_35927/g.55177  ORF Transcript_35927/g.55177 Transcript_35927/m.55177 type:complete len:210 (+) Transcript_35927:1060-1689(+)
MPITSITANCVSKNAPSSSSNKSCTLVAPSRSTRKYIQPVATVQRSTSLSCSMTMMHYTSTIGTITTTVMSVRSWGRRRRTPKQARLSILSIAMLRTSGLITRRITTSARRATSTASTLHSPTALNSLSTTFVFITSNSPSNSTSGTQTTKMRSQTITSRGRSTSSNSNSSKISSKSMMSSTTKRLTIITDTTVMTCRASELKGLPRPR